ncbi:uncharacterized protein N7529_010658 [Penicillium soppii]|uniref:uncharacterized protein n=1 Tax=Penicillium soppii TaxID=69789 RepID=UPI00254876FA|nr:uncharacterized protein N7529_010658 [Penicillium soppii]KAJ5851273.1 hypothetical protein N7529_010658 [Penicillium soppii]
MINVLVVTGLFYLQLSAADSDGRSPFSSWQAKLSNWLRRLSDCQEERVTLHCHTGLPPLWNCSPTCRYDLLGVLANVSSVVWEVQTHPTVFCFI